MILWQALSYRHLKDMDSGRYQTTWGLIVHFFVYSLTIILCIISPTVTDESLHRKNSWIPITGITVKVKQIPLEGNHKFPLHGHEIFIIRFSWLLIFFISTIGYLCIPWWDFITIPSCRRYIQVQRLAFILGLKIHKLGFILSPQWNLFHISTVKQ